MHALYIQRNSKHAFNKNAVASLMWKEAIKKSWLTHACQNFLKAVSKPRSMEFYFKEHESSGFFNLDSLFTSLVFWVQFWLSHNSYLDPVSRKGITDFENV